MDDSELEEVIPAGILICSLLEIDDAVELGHVIKINDEKIRKKYVYSYKSSMGNFKFYNRQNDPRNW